MRDAGLAQHVSLETRKPAGSCAIAEDAIAADALVQDGEQVHRLLQPARKKRRPTTVGIDGRIRPSVMESPNVTIARAGALSSTMTPARKKGL